MRQNYTAVIQQSDGWWIGWVQEIPGVNCQERTRDELLATLEITLRETIEYNREEALQAAEISMRNHHPNLARKSGLQGFLFTIFIR